MAIEILKWLGGFVQQTITTNTAMEVVSDIADIHYNHKRGRGIFSLCSTILVGAGGATLFVLEPAINTYFKTPILQLVPFVGNVVSTIGVGIIGAWFGGGFGNNVSKELAKAFEASGGNHSNSDYNNLTSIAQDIITANPEIFAPQADIENALGNNPFLQGQNVHQLAALLSSVVNLIDEHKNDGTTAHEDYKRAFLEATRQLNLMPLLELLNKNDAKRAVRIEGSQQIANYFANLPANAIANPFDRQVAVQAGQQQRQGRFVRRRRPQQRAAVVNEREIEAVPVEQAVAVPVPQQVNPHAQHEVPLVPGEAQPEVRVQMQPVPDNPVYKNMLRHFINLNEGKVEDPRRAKPITPRDPDFQLTQEQKTALFYQLQLTMHQQADKREKGRREAAPITGIFARARRA